MLKVGDKVRIRRDLKNIRYIMEVNLTTCHVVKGMAELAGTIQEIESISGRYIRLKDVAWDWHDKMFEPLPTQSIHITTDGDTVHAIQKEGGEVTKRAKAVCSPTDTFDFETGARLALDRLFGGVGVVLETHTPSEPELESPKFTLADFKAGKIAIHCGTEAKAKEFLVYLHGNGFKWREGGKLLEAHMWGWHKNQTTYSCFYRKLAVSTIEYATQNGLIVIPYNPADLE